MPRPATEKILFKHPNGQWCKKIKGKPYCFGTDYDAAINEFLECRDHLLAGRGKPTKSGDPKLAELANLYYDGCCQRVSSGDLSQRSLDESHKTLTKLIAYRGSKDQPSTWQPHHPESIRNYPTEERR